MRSLYITQAQHILCADQTMQVNLAACQGCSELVLRLAKVCTLSHGVIVGNSPSSWGEVALEPAIRVVVRASAAAHRNDNSQGARACHFGPAPGSASAWRDDTPAITALPVGSPCLELCELDQAGQLSSVVLAVEHRGVLCEQSKHAPAADVSDDGSTRSVITLHSMIWKNAFLLFPLAIAAGDALPDHGVSSRTPHHVTMGWPTLHRDVDIRVVRIRGYRPCDATLDPMNRICLPPRWATAIIFRIPVLGGTQLCHELSLRAQ
mmetsp:Transcript_137472/g.342935  ORF Transcript_137472/g.342935 Transcript_137472/m.342935 type:complete len:264 (-) Transcript_137472:1574-2365(-)